MTFILATVVLRHKLPGDTGYEVGDATLTRNNGTAVVEFVIAWEK